MSYPLHPQNVGRRRITFNNGRHEDVYAVAIDHEATGGERWEQIWVLRSSEMADRVVAALDEEGLQWQLELCAEQARKLGDCEDALSTVERAYYQMEVARDAVAAELALARAKLGEVFELLGPSHPHDEGQECGTCAAYNRLAASQPVAEEGERARIEQAYIDGSVEGSPIDRASQPVAEEGE